MEKGLLKIVLVLAILTVAGVITSCDCTCSNKFNQITYIDGRVEYYTSADVCSSCNEGFLKISVRDSAGNVEKFRYIPISQIKAVDEIEGDLPTKGDTTVIVNHKNDSLPNNIKIK